MDKPKRINRAEDCGWYFDHDYWTDYKNWIKRLKEGMTAKIKRDRQQYKENHADDERDNQYKCNYIEPDEDDFVKYEEGQQLPPEPLAE